MQDSFEARMQGQVPETVKTKNGKGWMICSIVLLFLLVGVCVFGGMIIMKGDRDTNRLADVESQLKEKDAKIEELEKENSSHEEEIAETTKVSKIELAKLIKTTGGDFISPKKIEYTNDGKYLYAITNVTEVNTVGGFAGIWYKSTEDGSEWIKLQAGHQLISCSNYTDEQKQFMENYKYIDDDLDSKYIGCYEDASGTKVFPE